MPSTEITEFNSLGLVLAGGRSFRMGQVDKRLLPFQSQTLIEHCLKCLRDQGLQVLLNCNDVMQTSAEEIILDQHRGKLGPLDGLISTMEWLVKHNTDVKWLLSVPVDCPFLPQDLFVRLKSPIEKDPAIDIVIAESAGRSHYTVGLWSLSLAQSGRKLLESGQYALKEFVAIHKTVKVNFENDEVNPFFNINTPEDYEHALKFCNNDCKND